MSLVRLSPHVAVLASEVVTVATNEGREGVWVTLRDARYHWIANDPQRTNLQTAERLRKAINKAIPTPRSPA